LKASGCETPASDWNECIPTGAASNCRREAKDSASMSASRTTRRTAMPADERLRTVVVDDEAIARRRLCRLLGNDPEINVIAECCEGREAIQVLLVSQVDLLFLDVQMPEMDGFQMLRALPA